MDLRRTERPTKKGPYNGRRRNKVQENKIGKEDPTRRADEP